MAVTPASLKAAHPEFETATNGLVQSMIDYAELMVNPGTWGSSADMGITLLACHYLAMTPAGREMRLDPAMKSGGAGLGMTAYGIMFERLETAASCGLGRVV